jgi:hypothetical protein
MKMNKFRMVQAIVKLYFIAALAGSFTHIITAAEKIGLSGWEMYSTPFMIDGLAIIGMVMRSEEFASRTRKIGFRVQLTMGAMSLTANVYAAHNIGGMIYGVGIVALFLAAEWLGDKAQMQSAKAEADALAQAEAERIVAEAAAEVQARKAAAIAKGKATRAKNARTKATQTKALESLLK